MTCRANDKKLYLFEIQLREYKNSFDEKICVYRGDISPIQGRDRAIAYLRKMYPGCKIRVTNFEFKIK